MTACLVLFLLPFQGLAGPLVRLSELTELPAGPEIQSDYGILIEAKSGAVLYEKASTEKAYPASITKIMTAILTMESCSLSDSVTFSYRATHEIEPGSSNIARTEGEVMTVEECLYGLMVASANEVAQGLAEHVSGSLESFVARMNRKAEELGCVNTHFANTHGYHRDDHYSCAYDMALIMQEALKYDELITIMGTDYYEIPPTNKHNEITYLRSTHPMLTTASQTAYPYALAGKTGFTDEALCTLVTYAKKDDLDLICVVMHAESKAVTGKDSGSLFDYGFREYDCYDLSALDSVWIQEDTPFLGKNLIRFSAAQQVYCTLPHGLGVEQLKSQIFFYGTEGENGILAARSYTLMGTEVARTTLKLTPASSGIELKEVIQVVPTRNEILRQKHLGLPLIYWILIGGGVLLILLIWFSVWFTLRSVRRYQRKKAQAKRAMDRMTDDRFPPLI